MVCGFVKQEQIVVKSEESTESEPHGPSAGEGRHGSVELRDSEAEPHENGFGARFHLISTGRGECLHGIVIIVKCFGVTDFKAGHDLLQTIVGHGPRAQVIEHVLKDGAFFEWMDLLRQIADRAFSVTHLIAAVERFGAEENFIKGGLAGSIFA